MKLRRYPAYKDSGVNWIGEVPSHWSIRRLKEIVRFSGGGTPARDNPAFWNGGIPWISPKDMKAELVASSEESITAAGLAGSASSLVPQGTLLMVVRSGILKHTIPVGLNTIPVALNQDMKALHPSRIRSDFLLRWVQGLNDRLLLAWAKQGATVESIEHDYLANTLIPHPDDGEQRAIAAFLDRETAKIDALIAEQQLLLELLAEKRQAVISHAVTKGLDPDAPMKDSGVAWLGEVPAHWECWKVRHAFRSIGSGTTPPSDESSWYEGGDVPWITTGELRERVIYETQKCVTRFAIETFSSLRLHPEGSLAIAMYGATIGRLGILGVAATTNQACCVLSDSSNLDVHFVFYWLSCFRQRLIDLYSSGGGQPNINQDIVANLKVPAPSLAEQRRIVDHLDKATRCLDSMAAECDRAVSLLRERRSALIAAAVTGQIDVREAA